MDGSSSEPVQRVELIHQAHVRRKLPFAVKHTGYRPHALVERNTTSGPSSNRNHTSRVLQGAECKVGRDLH